MSILLSERFTGWCLALCLFVTTAGTSAAQSGQTNRLGRAQAIVAAWSASAEARAAEFAVAAAAGRIRQAGAIPNPSLSWEREQTSASGVRNHQDIIAVEQRFEFGLRSARVASARAREQAAVARLAMLRAQIAFETTRAYLSAVSAQQRLRLAEQTASVFTRAVNVSRAQLAAGDVSGYANRRLRLEAARYATVQAAEQLEARTSMLTLASLVSRSADSIALVRLQLVDSIPILDASSAGSLDSLIGVAWRERGDIRALELEEAAARADARAATAGRVPQPALMLGVKSERTAEQPSGRGLVLGLSVPVPVWDRRSGEIVATSADVSRRGAELIALKRRVAREVAEAFESLKAAEQATQLLREELGESTQRSMNAVQVAWSEGEISLLEWLDAVRAYQEAESLAITLRAQAMIRRAALDHALGLAGPLTAASGSREGDTP